MGKADAFIIGGAMANTFRLAQGYQIGKSLAEPDKTDLALQILDKAEKSGIEFLLPADTRHTAEFRDDAPTECTAVWGEGGAIPDDREGIDIGDKAIEEFSKKIAEAAPSSGTAPWASSKSAVSTSAPRLSAKPLPTTRRPSRSSVAGFRHRGEPVRFRRPDGPHVHRRRRLPRIARREGTPGIAALDDK